MAIGFFIANSCLLNQRNWLLTSPEVFVTHQFRSPAWLPTSREVLVTHLIVSKGPLRL